MKLKLSLSSKLYINNIFYALPIIVLMYMMINSYDKDLVFARKELMGNEVQKTAMELINLVVKNQKYTPEMESFMSQILKHYDNYRVDLQLDESSLAVRKREHIQKNNLASSFENYKKSNKDSYKILKELREVIIHTGDTSNLILDPDLDSYYLMDITLLASPQIADRFYEIENFLLELSKDSSDQISTHDQVRAAVYLSMLRESDWGRIFADAGTAINEDKNFYGLNSSLQEKVKNDSEKINSLFQQYFTLLEEVANGKKDKVLDAINLTPKLIDESHRFYILTNATLNELLITRIESIFSSRNNAVGIGIGAILFALIVSFLTARSFTRGSKKIALALKDLSGAVKVNAEASDKLNESSKSLSNISSKQASAVQETMSSLHEINAMSERNSDSIKVSSERANLSKEQAVVGKKAIYDMASNIREISNGNQEFFAHINASNEDLKKIVRIIADITQRTTVINDIVFQTRLLSFNASVEAARAGEHGKGFAVVAEEIGKLATVSGKSAQEINEILQSATEQVESIISGMNSKVSDLTVKAKVQLNSGERITEECVNSLNQIVDSVSELSSMMNDIELSIAEQSKGYAEITNAIGQIDEGVHQGLGLSQETSSNAERLTDQVGELKRIVSTIEQEVLGKKEETT